MEGRQTDLDDDRVECEDTDGAFQGLTDMIDTLTRLRDRLGDVPIYAQDMADGGHLYLRVVPTLDAAGEVVLRLRRF